MAGLRPGGMSDDEYSDEDDFLIEDTASFSASSVILYLADLIICYWFIVILIVKLCLPCWTTRLLTLHKVDKLARGFGGTDSFTVGCAVSPSCCLISSAYNK